MKYTIHGFSQVAATEFKKTAIDEKGKEKKIKIDCTDLLLLRWFVDFYPKMVKVEIDGSQYAWVKYQQILDDLPLLDIRKRALSNRFQKMCEFKILKHKTVRSEGTFSYYGFDENYAVLIEDSIQGVVSQMTTRSQSNDERVVSQMTTRSQSNDERVVSQMTTRSQSNDEQINYSIKDTSTKNNKTIKDTIYIESEFERVWKMYPNKKGKEKAKVAFIKAVKAGIDVKEIEDGIKNYVLFISETNTSSQFIKHGSTWFSQKCWQDDYKTNTGEQHGNDREHIAETSKPKYGEYI